MTSPIRIFVLVTILGFMYSDQLSETLRTALQPMTRFRQFCDARDASGMGYHSGNTYRWNIYSDVGTQGAALTEAVAMPETNYTIAQASLTITEYGRLIAAFINSLMPRLAFA